MATIADRIKAARGVDGDSNSTSRVVELVRGRLSGIVEANRIREEEEKRKKTEENLRKSQEEAQKNIEEFQKQRDSLGGRFYSMLGAMPTLPSLSIEGEDYTRAREEDEAGMSARLEKKSPVASFKESVDEKGFFNTVGDIEAGAAENLLELASGTAKLAVGFTPFGGYSNVRKIAKFIGNDQVDEYIDRNTPEWMEQTGSWLDENGILNYKADYKNEMQKTGGVVAEIGTFFIPLSRALKIEKAISLVPKFAKILGTAPKVAKVGGKFVLEVSLDVLDNVALDAMRGQDADTILENAKYSAIGGAGLRAVGGGLGAALKKGKTNRLIATMEGSGLGKLSDEESKIASEIINDGRPIDDAYTKIIERRSEEGTLADDFGDIFKEDVPAVKTSATQEIPKTPDSQKLPDSPEVKNGIAPETKPADVETPKVEKVETPTVKKEAESPLIQEAKKYKSAEEFWKNNIGNELDIPGEGKAIISEITDNGKIILDLDERVVTIEPGFLEKIKSIDGVTIKDNSAKIASEARDAAILSKNEAVKIAEKEASANDKANLYGFEKTLTPLQHGRVADILDRKIRTRDIGTVTKKEFILSRVLKDNMTVKDGILGVADRKFNTGSVLNKTEEKFAVWVQNNKSQLTDIWNKSQPLQEGVEKVSNEIPKAKPNVETPKVEGNAKQKKVVSDKQPEVPKVEKQSNNETKGLQEPGQQSSSRLTKLEGTGEEKVRGVARSTVKKSVASGFDISGEMLPKYKKHNQKADIDFWSNKISNGEIDYVRSVANAEIEPPKGFSAEGAYIALTETADKKMIEELIYNSALVEEATTMGQRTSIWQQLNPFSAVKVGSDIIKERVSRIKYDKVTAEKSVRKSLEFKLEDAKEIINDLICK